MTDDHPGEGALDQDTLRAALDYDPATGSLRWCHRADRDRQWNTRWAGRLAGCLTATPPAGVYRQVNLAGWKYAAHRMAVCWMTGTWPPEEVDHINGDGGDNRWINLRLCHRSLVHARVPGGPSQVRHKGVSRTRGRFRARIKVRGVEQHLGVWETAEEAHDAYAEAARREFGLFANPETDG